jgi:hypothetical protein
MRCSLASVLFREHDRNHPADNGCSIWIVDIWLFIQIDLEEDRVAVDFERAEIVLFVRIILMASS